MSKIHYNITVTKVEKHQEFKQKFKTELCKNWAAGTCEFDKKCIFAHGIDELRNVTGANYKTKNCKQFHEKGYCQYGIRCQFRHRAASQETAASSPIGTPREQTSESSKKRLPIFLKIAPPE